MTLRIDDSNTISRSFSEKDVALFSELSRDFNPIHLNESYAKSSIFGTKIVHGMLVTSLFSGVMNNLLNVEGCILLGHTMRFKAPVKIDETVTASAKIIHIRHDKPIVTIELKCINESGILCVEGEANVKVPENKQNQAL